MENKQLLVIAICGDQACGSNEVLEFISNIEGKKVIQQFIVLKQEEFTKDKHFKVDELKEAILNLKHGGAIVTQLQKIDPKGKAALFFIGPQILKYNELLPLIQFKLYIQMPDDMRCARILNERISQKKYELDHALREYIEIFKPSLDKLSILKKNASIVIPTIIDHDLSIILVQTQSLELIKVKLNKRLNK